MCNNSKPLHKNSLLAWKRVYKLIFYDQKFVYRHNNKIKPKKAKLFSDVVVKNDAIGIFKYTR